MHYLLSKLEYTRPKPENREKNDLLQISRLLNYSKRLYSRQEMLNVLLSCLISSLFKDTLLRCVANISVFAFKKRNRFHFEIYLVFFAIKMALWQF